MFQWLPHSLHAVLPSGGGQAAAPCSLADLAGAGDWGGRHLELQSASPLP